MSEEKQTERDKRYELAESLSNRVKGTFGQDIESWEHQQPTGRNFSPNHKAIIGICASCGAYEYAINDVHQIVHAVCKAYKRTLGRNRIVECSRYYENGRLSLAEMAAIATLIDVDDKLKIGF